MYGKEEGRGPLSISSADGNKICYACLPPKPSFTIHPSFSVCMHMHIAYTRTFVGVAAGALIVAQDVSFG